MVSGMIIITLNIHFDQHHILKQEYTSQMDASEESEKEWHYAKSLFDNSNHLIYNLVVVEQNDNEENKNWESTGYCGVCFNIR